ncbi:heptaprenyl diphosphate synthase component 1 [Cytobacillus sp. NCCP-133]|uniref:heptaprenyl diphosphate synthase component 1 n=1 Tax=Cytobacillus sp. NCCP-133 TaxID=766848 RepID=UPI002231CBE5|nr:heptaprenyl diphosphate synthase component 1 [Cytobacillus sp. NCCP-133]GLB57996.1 heptaprenyl diphosphate synthase subunit I [Cytobacillus sp. NCCP-133]
MHDVKIKLADVKEQIEKKIHHPYLLRYIDSPFIDEDKLLLLISILDDLKISDIKAKKYAITTMLIQIALDTHELVMNDETEDGDLKNRQLTVLAGVYYSGLYYKILSELDDIGMIRSLADGIKVVNEHKISLYQKAPIAVDSLMNSVKRIEAALFEKLADAYNKAEWKEIASNLLFIKRLIAEKEQFVHYGTSIVFEALKKLTFPKVKEISAEQQNYLLHICDRYIDFSRNMVDQYLMKIPFVNELLEQRIHYIYNHSQSVAKTFVEEG